MSPAKMVYGVRKLIGGKKCKMCGCTNNVGCKTTTGTCHWVKDDLCSNCV